MPRIRIKDSMLNYDRPKHHKIISEDTRSPSGNQKSMKRYQLEYNSEVFKQAACAGMDTEVFYPEESELAYEKNMKFKRLCSECPIMEACLEWGLAHEKYGIWGGTTPKERGFLRTQMKWAVSEPASRVQLFTGWAERIAL